MKYLLSFFMLLSFMLASVTTHAGPGRPSFSSRPSYGGFRSSGSPSYRSFSSSPSRTFTFRSTAPRYSAPAAPRYSAPSTSTSKSTYRSSSKTTVNNHYHGGSTASGGGGLGLMDYVILDNMLSRDRGPSYTNAPARTVVVDDSSYERSTGTVVYQSESHFWRNLLLLVLGLAFCYGIYRLCKATETASQT